MLLTVRFPGAGMNLPETLLGGETEHHEEFWFGQALAWSEESEGCPGIHFSVLVEVPRIVARTRRRDREERFSVSYCDSYPYTASGLMGLFIARLRLKVPPGAPRRLSCKLVCYPERPYSLEIARRLFSTIGYDVKFDSQTFSLDWSGAISRALSELPVLLLALDRRTRLFLSTEELEEIGQGSERWITSHPAERAIRLALRGRATPIRHLVPNALETGLEKQADEEDDPPCLQVGTISTSLIPSVQIAESQRDFASKAYSKINIDKRWLIYLPSAIASLQEASKPEIESPTGALSYFRDELIERVVVEEKHMGSRGVVILCRDHHVARARFGIDALTPGCAYTRNARRFFRDEDTEAVFIERLHQTLTNANFWRRFSTDWMALDGEILPWAIKASEFSEDSDLVQMGALTLQETRSALQVSASSGLKSHWRGLIEQELAGVQRYDSMFKKYRTECADLSALRFAPFHLLAVENQTLFHRSHLWHMQVLARLARSGRGFVVPTRYQLLDTRDRKSWSTVLRWWDELSESSSEGFVVKPLPFVPRGRRGLAQPALKCRTREHLRLVYGPRYDDPEAKDLLLCREALSRRRNKHRRILRQFALSMEAVTRFVQRKSLDDVHECILGVLAQEVAPKMKS